MDFDRMITTEEAQALTDYTGEHLRRLARQGTVITRKIGRSWLFDRESLMEYHKSVRPGRPKEKD